jgi:hypothetical protein
MIRCGRIRGELICYLMLTCQMKYEKVRREGDRKGGLGRFRGKRRRSLPPSSPYVFIHHLLSNV